MSYANTAYAQYVHKIADIEKTLVDLRLKADSSAVFKKKELTKRIKQDEESVAAMKIAMPSLGKFNCSFAKDWHRICDAQELQALCKREKRKD